MDAKIIMGALLLSSCMYKGAIVFLFLSSSTVT